MSRTRAAASRLWERFWSAVDAEVVTVFQYVFGVIFVAAGVYGIFVAKQQPPLSLRGSMSHMDLRMFYWLNIVGPFLALIGKTTKGTLTYAGMWLQLAGDITITIALLAFITGTVQVESWGKGAYGAFLGAAMFACAVITVTRDVRRLLQVEKQIK